MTSRPHRCHRAPLEMAAGRRHAGTCGMLGCMCQSRGIAMTRPSEGPIDVREQTLCLQDGRHLAYLDLGPPTGRPILCCHGIPGSRLDFLDYGEWASHHRVRLIVPDRPGCGYSTFHRSSQLEWASDAIELLDMLGLAKTAVLGVSGGAGFA